jgi:outer membrane receptor protein involved in Fe transport
MAAAISRKAVTVICRSLALALPLWLGGSFAGAADPGSSPREEQVEEIEVTGHYQNSIGTSEAASAGVITRQLIEDRPILRPGEVLELVPGLIITQHSGAGKANQYYLRGFNLDHGTDFTTALDGVPLNLRSHAHGQGYTDLNFLIPELVDRVEYFKGPYFASKGDFASAGAADIHYGEQLPESLARLTAGSFAYLRGLLAGSPELGGGRLLYGLEYMHDDGPWVHSDNYRRWNGVLRYTHPLGEGTASLSALAYRGTWNATDQIPLRAVQQGVLGLYDTVDPTTGGDTFRYGLTAAWRGPVAGGDLEAVAYGVRYQLHLFSNFTYFLDQVHGDQFEQADDRWLYGIGGAWVRDLDPGGIRTTVKAGWEGRVDRILPVGLYQTQARVVWEMVRRDEVVETSGGLFAEAEHHWASWLKTIEGLRYDQYRFDVSSSRSANSGVRTAGRASPKASAILGPFAQTELFANFGLGFHSNDARGVTLKVDPLDGTTPVSSVTPLVGTRGDEVGLRTELLPGVQSSLSLWELVMGSELLFTGDAGTTEPSRPSRRQGLEWSTRWHPLRWLLFDLDLAFSKARFTEPLPAGQHIPGAIESAVSAGATVHELGPWSGAIFLRYFGPRPLKEDNSIRSTGATILNAQASWRFGRNLRLELEVLNLLDAKADDIAYSYTSQMQAEPAPVDGIHVHPATSRSGRASVVFSY